MNPTLSAGRFLAASLLVTSGLIACGGDETPDAETERADVGPESPDIDGSGPDVSVGTGCQPGPCADLTASGTPLQDLDEDGIPDCEEGEDDADGDGIPHCTDPDSDGDNLPDSAEGTQDSDEDGATDYLDNDSDDDGIRDLYEGDEDPDADGIPNYLDTDSDNDGFLDSQEFGRQPGTDASAVDRDADGSPDPYDLDSDGDGLADAEELGCPDASDRARIDSDGDTVTDLLEVLFGSDPCDSDSDLTGLVDFYFVLPYATGDVQRDTLDFNTAVTLGDVLINIDTTGSMSGQINSLQAGLSDIIIPGLAENVDSIGIGVSQFEDFPCGEFGSPGDLPFALLQRITTDPAAAERGVQALDLGGGGDGPESGIESLFQAATGLGTNDCQTGLIPPFDPLRGLSVGTAEGIIGGAGFRAGAMPIVVHITDNETHADGERGYTYGATRDEAYTALRDIGARVIGIATSTTPRSDLETLADRTSAEVPTCAWDNARPAGCGVGQCCTGQDGAGRAPASDGLCPLVFDIRASGQGLGTAIVDGIAALLRYAPSDVTVRVRPDAAELARSGINTGCFVQSVRADAAFARTEACSTQPVAADFDGDGVNEGFSGVTPGANLFFEVTAYNDCVRATTEPQTFFAYLDVIAGGDVVLDTQLVTILVPPDFKNSNDE